MGITYLCDPASGLSVEVWDGDITAEQVSEHIEKLAADPQWSESRRLVTDLTGMSVESRPNAARIAWLAETFLRQLAYLVGDIKWSVVADQTFDDALGFGARVKHEVRRMIVFNSLETACVWLGLEPNAVRPVIDRLRRQLRAESDSP